MFHRFSRRGLPSSACSGRRACLHGLSALLVLLLVLSGCSSPAGAGSSVSGASSSSAADQTSVQSASEDLSASDSVQDAASSDSSVSEESSTVVQNEPNPVGTDFTAADIPPYAGRPSVVIHDNVPFFESGETSNTAFQHYFDLDALGRVTLAYASLGPELQPEEKRGDISHVHPTGFENTSYDFMNGDTVYNRCHLIAFMLSGQNDNPKNLMTGTRYMNVDGMLPYEKETDDYIDRTGNHVMYRVTPVFKGDDLVARGVLMEAKSVEDDGAGLQFCVFCYNVQPGVSIDYATGRTQADGSITTSLAADTPSETPPAASDPDLPGNAPTQHVTYVINTNTGRFHRPSCKSVTEMKAKNRLDVTESREDVLAQGYTPCKRCNP